MTRTEIENEIREFSKRMDAFTFVRYIWWLNEGVFTDSDLNCLIDQWIDSRLNKKLYGHYTLDACAYMFQNDYIILENLQRLHRQLLELDVLEQALNMK